MSKDYNTIFPGSLAVIPIKKPLHTRNFLAPYHNLGVLKETNTFRGDDAITRADLLLGSDLSPNKQ